MTTNQTLWLDQGGLRVGANQLTTSGSGVGVGTSSIYGSFTAGNSAVFFGNVGVNNPSPNSNFSVTGNASISSGLVLGAGSSTAAPLRITAGTNLTAATAGVIEYDGVAPYFTPADTQRGVIPGAQWYALAANLTGQITIANTGQTATFTAANPTVVTVTTAPTNGTIVVFSTTGTMPAGLTAGVQYFVVNSSLTTTFSVAAIRGGTALGTGSTGTATTTAVFHCSIANVGCNLSANTRYAYEIQTTVLKSSANAAAVQYAITSTTGSFNWHSYMVSTMNAANFLTPTAPTLMTNIISSAFSTPVSVTAASGAIGVYYPLFIKGVIDVGTVAATNVNFTIGFTAVPTTSQFNQGTYIYIYPIPQNNTVNTNVGSWI